MRVDAEIPLRPGINVVVIVARESADVLSRRTLVIRRDAADGSLMETPPSSEEWFHIGVDPEE